MQNKNFFVTKFAFIAVLIGFLSPSIFIETSPSENSSYLKDSRFTKPSLSSLSISIFAEARARSEHGGRSHGNRGSQGHGRTHGRSSNYRHRRPHYRPHHRPHYKPHYRPHHVQYHEPYYEPYYEPYIEPYYGGVAVGGYFVNEYECEIVYIRGLRYQDCGDGLIRY